ncbi:MAG TPA: ubiquitin-activating E1 FCCH domain-containing protein [Pseudolysinimonas sp.]|jgi:hypothetical protein
MPQTVDELFYPIVLTQAGAQPQSPLDLRSQLINLVTYGTDKNGAPVIAPVPGYTANLPGSLIEDISSTDTAALIICDQARVELLNSLTPYGANAFILNQLGQLLGIPIGTQENVTVGLLFTGPAGFLIQKGFLVGDGTHSYSVQQAVAIGSTGFAPIVNAIATVAGQWAVPSATVTTVQSSVPSPVSLTVTNPDPGTGGTTPETEQQYRLRVMQAERVTCQGTPDFLKTLLMAVSGVLPQQVAIQAVSGGLWKVIVGGATPDQFAIANAIYQGVPILSSLTGSVMTVASVTKANPGVVVTVLNHGYATGQVVTFSGCLGMTELNTGSYTITVTDEKTFSIGVDTSSFGVYSGGGQVLPNLRNNSVTISDFPDTYTIPWVTPPKQTVEVDLTWNATSTLASEPAISQLAQTTIINFVNAVPVGAPINQYALEESVFNAIEAVVDTRLISVMTWVYKINGVVTVPNVGTGIVQGDSESYFSTDQAHVTVTGP